MKSSERMRSMCHLELPMKQVLGRYGRVVPPRVGSDCLAWSVPMRSGRACVLCCVV